MKSAAEVLNDRVNKWKGPGLPPPYLVVCIEAMQEYAFEVAKQALIDAAANAKLVYNSGEPGRVSSYHRLIWIGADNVQVDKESIRLSGIKLP